MPANTLDVPAFAGSDPQHRAAVAAGCRYETVQAGEVVFGEGDPSDSVVIVRTGLLEVVTGSPPARVRLLSRGAVVGELGIITRRPRSATVRALRRSEIAVIDAAAMRLWIDDDEGLRTSLMSSLAVQVAEHRSPADASDPPARRSVALVNGDGYSGPLCLRLAEAVAANVSTDIVVDPAALGLGPEPDAGELAARIARSDADRVVLVADDARGPWATACAQAADRVVAVLGTAAPSGPVAGTGGWEGIEIVGPSAVTQSIDGAVFVHRMVGPGGTDGVDRIARRLAGTSIGLVLSGGGARVLAHIGVIDVLEERGVVIDRVSTTSMGALVAALYAGGADAAGVRQGLIDLDLVKLWLTLGPSAAAAAAARYVADRCDPAVRDLTLLSVDLLTGVDVLHGEDDVALGTEAAMALPGLIPPVQFGERSLVDGALTNPLPVNVLHAQGDGPIIAVDVSGRTGRIQHWTSKWKEADRAQLDPADVAIQAMDLAAIHRHRAAVGLADLLIQPPAKAGALAFDSLDTLVAVGRRAAEEVFQSNAEGLSGVLAGVSAQPR